MVRRPSRRRNTEGGTSSRELLAIIREAKQQQREAVDLSNRNITELPDEFGGLTSLRELTLDRNQLRALPESIGQLANLQTLNLNGNQLTELPESIVHLANLETLYLDHNQLKTLPESIVHLANLKTLNLNGNQLTELPESIAHLANLQTLNLSQNPLRALPESIVHLTNLQALWLDDNQLRGLPESIVHLANLKELDLGHNQLTTLPESIVHLVNLEWLALDGNQLRTLPESIGHLANLQTLELDNNQLTTLQESIVHLTNLKQLYLANNQLTTLPESIVQLTNLETLDLNSNQLTTLPESIVHLANLQDLTFNDNQLTTLPSTLANLDELQQLQLDDNPLNPTLQSAYDSGLDELKSYLRSLAGEVERLYEAKLVLVGEGGVGKTTLLKALTGREPREGEPSTHGANVEIQSLRLPHPAGVGVEITFNAWDFGGQDVYRVTHQFFFSPYAVYLLVWEPRLGVQACQVEDWLRLIRLRVGSDARVVIVSTHCRTGGRIARIDKPVFERDFSDMIVGFLEVDSMVDDESTGDKVGVAELKSVIVGVAKDLPQMGTPFNLNWRRARDELLSLEHPRIPYKDFSSLCQGHGLDGVSANTLARQMHDLGYTVYYGDDERLKNDVVLQPEWLTKAIGFVLEDQRTQEMDGILPDARLGEVWMDHPFAHEPRFEPELHSFFLRLMERYDVAYRLEAGDASLVAQHVPQVRPPLPWMPDDEIEPDRRRIALVCVMDEEPPGLVPWMIVRTHDYACTGPVDGAGPHLLHWQKGMFLRYKSHGEAMLELRGREFHVYAQAVWPDFFMEVLTRTVQKVITDNWPGMEGRYFFAVPCRGEANGRSCAGRFDIDALRQFLTEGDETMPCQTCRTRQNIVELLFGFPGDDSRTQLDRIESMLADTQRTVDGLDSQIAGYVMGIMQAIANESKDVPRLFTVEPVDGDWRRLVTKQYRLRLWCEADDCQHPVDEDGKGLYEFRESAEWIRQVAPYAKFVAGVLSTAATVALPAANAFLGGARFDESGVKRHLELVKEATGAMVGSDLEGRGRSVTRGGLLSDQERSGLLALHVFLRNEDPTHQRLGLTRVPTYTGDYRWLCRTHYEAAQPKFPDSLP